MRTKPNSSDKRRMRAAVVLRELKKLFPSAAIALKFSNNWELVVAVMLSAQCTDKKVNEVTRGLFKKYAVIGDYADAKAVELEADIRPTGFFRNKARNIRAAAQMILKNYDGKIPDSMDELLKVPGIGRKTANVILGVAYGKTEGIAVDTHVIRLSRLYGLTDKKDAASIERELMEILPRSEWISFTYRMIEYGRQYCPARKHNHNECPLAKALFSKNKKALVVR